MHEIRTTTIAKGAKGSEANLRLFLKGIRSLLKKWTPSVVDSQMREVFRRFNVDVVGGSQVFQSTSHTNYVSQGQQQKTPTRKAQKKQLPKNEAYFGPDALRFGIFAEEIDACTLMTAFFNHMEIYMIDNWKAISHSTKMVLSSVMHVMLHQHSMLSNTCKSEQAIYESQKTIRRFKRLTGNVFVQEHQEQDGENGEDENSDSDSDDGSEAEEVEDSEEDDEELLNPYTYNGLDTKIECLFSHTNKPMKPIEFGIRYLYERARVQGLCREGEEMRCRRSIPHYVLVKTKGEYICQICEKPESAHPVELGRRCSDHVFRPQIAQDLSITYDTCSWERPLEHYSVKDWVHKELTSELVPKTWRDTLSVKSRIVQEILSTVNESSLPVLNRQLSEDRYGPVVAFQNGVYFIQDCIWKDYRRLAEDIKKGIYPGLVTHYVHEWFFIGRYTTAMKGAYDPTMTDRPEVCRYENVHPNYVCENCNTLKKHHKTSCKRPVFKRVQCNKCEFKTDDITKPCECEGGPEYFNVDIAAGLSKVPTPFMDSVMDLQFRGLTDHKSYLGLEYWMFALAGYFLLPKNPSDPTLDWPIIPCIFGVAGSGKSILMSALSKLVSQEKIGTLSSNAQETFGLEALVSYDGNCQKKYLILEASGKFKIPPQQFQVCLSVCMYDVCMMYVCMYV